jgi:hypothetical protein
MADEKLHIWRKYRPEQPSDTVDTVHELTRFGGFSEAQAQSIARVLDDRAQFQKNDYREAFLTIERWADRNFPIDINVPFIVVANDGSPADFTSIKDAIDSVAAGGQGYIWVKDTGTTYSDAGPVAFGTKDITIFGAGSGDVYQGGNLVRWDVSGATWATSSSGANLNMQNLFFAPAATTWGGATSLNVRLFNTYVDNIISSGVNGVIARHSSVNISAGISFFNVIDCNLGLASGSYSLRGSRIEQCQINMGSGTATLNNPGTSTGEYGIFNDNVFNGGTYVFSGWSEIEFVGNLCAAEVVFGPTLSGPITVTFESCRNVHYASNLWGSTVTFSGTGANNRGSITGTAYLMTIAGDGFVFDVMMEGDRGLGSTPAGPGLTISGDHNSGTVVCNNYTLGTDVTGGANVVTTSGLNVTTLIQSNGAGNKLIVEVGGVINPAAPGGTDVYL